MKVITELRLEKKNKFIKCKAKFQMNNGDRSACVEVIPCMLEKTLITKDEAIPLHFLKEIYLM